VRGDPTDLSKQISKHKCPTRPPQKGCRASEPAKLVVRRGARTLRVDLRPIYDPLAKRSRLGFAYAAGPREQLSFGESNRIAIDRFWFITKETLSLPAKLFNPQERKQINGIVGSYEITRQTILNDLAEVVGILAIISLSLAIINLFPFLPLDGGHIFWAIVEKVRGRPIPFSVMERAGMVGFMIVILLFLLGLTNDIDRLSGEGFQVR
jgi:regulator of sigma E protease